MSTVHKQRVELLLLMELLTLARRAHFLVEALAELILLLVRARRIHHAVELLASLSNRLGLRTLKHGRRPTKTAIAS